MTLPYNFMIPASTATALTPLFSSVLISSTVSGLSQAVYQVSPSDKNYALSDTSSHMEEKGALPNGDTAPEATETQNGKPSV